MELLDIQMTTIVPISMIMGCKVLLFEKLGAGLDYCEFTK